MDLQEKRNEVGYTQAELAEECGVSRKTVEYWEREDFPESAVKLLSQAFGLHPFRVRLLRTGRVKSVRDVHKWRNTVVSADIQLGYDVSVAYSLCSLPLVANEDWLVPCPPGILVSDEEVLSTRFVREVSSSEWELRFDRKEES